MKSGDKIPTMAGTTLEIPYANEGLCFGRKGPKECTNKATWLMEGKNLMLVWCDQCKQSVEGTFEGQKEEWTKLEERP